MTHPNFATKVMGAGVLTKGIIMGTLVALLATTNFEHSLILVIVSASVTGLFGLLVVLIQVHSEKEIHSRINDLQAKVEERADQIDSDTTAIAQTTKVIADNVSETGNGQAGN